MLIHSPACSSSVLERDINDHLDSGCSKHKATRITENQLLAKEESKGKLAPIFSQGNLKSPGAPTDITSEGPSKKKRKVEVSSSVASGQKHANKRADTKAGTPLAERLRPQSLDEFVGQKHLTGPHSLLRNLLGSGSLGSIIFWGPPG